MSTRSQSGADIRRAIAAKEAAEKLAAEQAAQPPVTDDGADTRDDDSRPARPNKKEH